MEPSGFIPDGGGGEALPRSRKKANFDFLREHHDWVCAHCGDTANGRFKGDICPACGLTFLKCNPCGFTITAAKPPDVCPSCGANCAFQNITCYTPECGGSGNIDPRL